MLLRVGLLFILCAQCVTCSGNLTKRATVEELQKFIYALNFFRQKIAMAYGVANMHELRYDLPLEKEAETMRTCNELRTGHHFTPFLPPDANVWRAIHSFQFENLNDIIDRDDEVALQKFGFIILMIKPLMHPLQTKIGCAEFEKPCSTEVDSNTQNLFGFSSISHQSICLLGPTSSDSKSDVIKGPPGSKCETEMSVNGLCQPKYEHIDFNKQLGIGNEPLRNSQTNSLFFVFFMILLFIRH